MARQTVNTGSALADRSGDNGRVAFTKVNENFAELYANHDITAAETAAAVTPTNFGYPPGDVRRYGADPTGASSSSTALASALSALPSDGGNLYVPDGEYLLTSTWTISKAVRLICSSQTASAGVNGGVTFVKDSTLNGAGISVTADGAHLEGFVLDAEAGSGGDGVHIQANTVTLRSASIYNQAQDGVRIGLDGVANSNLWRLDQVKCRANGRYGLHIHSNTGGEPNANAGLATNVECTANTSHGVYVRNCLRNYFVGLLTEVNGGDGVRVDTPSFDHCFFGGDLSEGNTGDDVRIMSGAVRIMFIGCGIDAGAINDGGTATMVWTVNHPMKLNSGLTGEVLSNGNGPAFSGNDCYAVLSADAEQRIRLGWKDGTPTTGLVAAQIMAATTVLSLVARDIANSYVSVRAGSGIAEVARFDDSSTATHTRFMIYDVDNATLERVTVGAADSGGAGFKVLRIPN